MKKYVYLIAILSFAFILSACNSSIKSKKDSSDTSKESIKNESSITNFTVENSIIDNKDLQIWYEVEVSALNDAKNAKVNRVYLIQNNEIADLVLDSPGYSSDMTVEMYNEQNNVNITEKTPLTLGEIAQIGSTEKIYSELVKNYKNKASEGYQQQEKFEYYPITYKMKTDGSGNNMKLIDLVYSDGKILHFYEPMGAHQVYDGCFVGYWSHESTYESGSEYTRQTLTFKTNADARFIFDEPNSQKFSIE